MLDVTIAPPEDIFDMRDIDRTRGCAVAARSDQYVAHLLPLGAYIELATFLGGFMVQARNSAEGPIVNDVTA